MKQTNKSKGFKGLTLDMYISGFDCNVTRPRRFADGRQHKTQRGAELVDLLFT